ncbi:ArsR/SmtB family transcription factor [Acetobacter fallax]|uniref:Metalloregulator ArsR/SmtB family transcription factor n=1 Tax=Acetobacter fallax TaxID=1737473 RepID=A0ABX0KCV0_9PROT|nr:metalloregulator ArsR/SmtB family transcription factor [Acetobacter fallax]NHO32891.1 metalloregulator ArsR/SmtB family transcription factor [Acetobacter fallax]NHO36453.1 metalloregulator ArsR/SmtB family transcription factor [Acetobacter fallax]
MNPLTPDDARQLTERLRLLAQPQRLVILDLLLEGTLAVSDIETRSGIGQPTLSQQLGALRRAGIITAKRDSRSMHYSFSSETERHRTRLLLGLLHHEQPAGLAGSTKQTAPARAPATDGSGARFAQIIRSDRRTA